MCPAAAALAPGGRRPKAEAAAAARAKTKAAVKAKAAAAKAKAARSKEAARARALAAARKAAPAKPAALGPMQVAEMALADTRMLAPLKGRCFQMVRETGQHPSTPLPVSPSPSLGAVSQRPNFAAASRQVRDYWTYEFCPMRSIRQFRPGGGAEFSLGEYDKEQDKIVVGVKGALDKSFTPHVHSQVYTKGTSDRRSNVRVRCSTKNEHALLGVDEPSAHQYQVVFSTPLACELSCAYAYAAVPPGA